jgi:3-oxoacyl-[acyl-carrier-protein] synthase II
MSRVVVTGLGAITPIGNDVPTFWKNLTAGVSGAGTVTSFDASDFPVRIACEVKLRASPSFRWPPPGRR